jgi:hypothetical protein
VKRRTFDILAATGGLFLAVTLIVSGVLLAWAHNFIGNEVHTQLAAQKIYFPPAGSAAIKAPEFAAMRQYAGQRASVRSARLLTARVATRSPCRWPSWSLTHPPEISLIRAQRHAGISGHLANQSF